MRKDHIEKMNKSIEAYEKMLNGRWERNWYERYCARNEDNMDENPIKHIDRYLDLEPIKNQSVIAIKYIMPDFVIDMGVVLTFPQRKTPMLLIEYIDGTQAFLCNDRDLLKNLDEYKIYGEYYPRYYSPYPIEWVYDALSMVIPSFGEDDDYKYSLQFDHRNVLDLEFYHLLSTDNIRNMSDTARRKLRESCSLWSSLWILGRYDRCVVNDLMSVLSEVQDILDKYDNNSEKAVGYELWENADKAWFRSCIRYRGYPGLGGQNKIRIKNEAFKDELFDFEHIIIARNGIFIIKVQAGDGNLKIIDKNQWFWEEEGKKKGANNPRKWFRQREQLLRSFLPEDISIASICCIENDDGLIAGAEDINLNVIKLEDMGRFIMEYPCIKEYTEEEIVSIAENIWEHQERQPDWFS